MLKAHRVCLDQLRHTSVNFKHNALFLLVSLHFVRVNHFLQQLARIDALKFYLQVLLRNVGDVGEVLNVELDHAIAVLDSL